MGEHFSTKPAKLKYQGSQLNLATILFLQINTMWILLQRTGERNERTVDDHVLVKQWWDVTKYINLYLSNSIFFKLPLHYTTYLITLVYTLCTFDIRYFNNLTQVLFIWVNFTFTKVNWQLKWDSRKIKCLCKVDLKCLEGHLQKTYWLMMFSCVWFCVFIIPVADSNCESALFSNLLLS